MSNLLKKILWPLGFIDSEATVGTLSNFTDIYRDYCKTYDIQKQKNVLYNRDMFARKASSTKEYVSLMLLSIISTYYLEKKNTISHDDAKKYASRIINNQTDYLVDEYDLIEWVNKSQVRLEQAKLIADMIIEICWQFLDLQNIFLSFEDESEEIKGDIRRIYVSFSRMACEYCKLKRSGAESDSLIPLNDTTTDIFGWFPEDSAGWGFAAPNMPDGQLIRFSSYIQFFSCDSHQIVAGYEKVGTELKCVAENGVKFTGASGDPQPENTTPNWEWAKRKYQKECEEKRNGLGGTPFARIALSFSVPTGFFDFRLQIEKSIPTYAVYIVLDLQGKDLKDGELIEITGSLHRHISSLRLLATQQLAYHSLAKEMELRQENENYKKFYLGLQTNIEEMTASFDNVKNRLFDITSFVRGKNSLWLTRAIHCYDLFQESTIIPIGKDTISSMHNMSYDPTNTDPVENWCKVAVFRLSGDTDIKDLSISSISSYLSDDFNNNLDAPTIKALFFPSSDGDLFNVVNYANTLARFKEVLHLPFKMHTRGGYLNVLALIAAFPEEVWSDNIRELVKDWDDSETFKLFRGHFPLLMYADMIFFLSILLKIARDTLAAQGEDTCKLEVDMTTPSQNKIEIHFKGPGFSPFFTSSTKKMIDLPDIIKNICKYGICFKAKGDFTSAFTTLLAPTLACYDASNICTKTPPYDKSGHLIVPDDNLFIFAQHDRMEIANKDSYVCVQFNERACIITKKPSWGQ